MKKLNMDTLKNRTLIFFTLFLASLHFLRIGNYGYFGIYLICGALLFTDFPIKYILSTSLLIGSFFLWLKITHELVYFRILSHLPYLRLILIMGIVTLFNMFVILYIFSHYESLKQDIQDNFLSIFVFIAIFSILMFIRAKLSIKPLILDRFGLYLGNLEAFLLAVYGAYLGNKLKDPKSHKALRKKIWLLFSLVFFAQLFLGIFVNNQFLMTGKLHFPIPALIIGGPIYRGHGFFMICLFLSTIILVGPAWCSHLCYVGGLDAYTSSLRKTSKIRLIRHISFINLFLTFLLAIIFKLLKFPQDTLILVVSSFGIISLIFIFILSPFLGKMTHCISWCPIGIVSCTLGKVNPFRIRVDEKKCTSCGICEIKCPYQAISIDKTAKINFFCTLCGDCIAICPHNAISITYLKKKKNIARPIFLFLIIVIHTIFLGLARI